MGAQYDDTLMAMMRQHKDEMEFLNNIFGFLQRKTQCFNGPKVRADPAPTQACVRAHAMHPTSGGRHCSGVGCARRLVGGSEHP